MIDLNKLSSEALEIAKKRDIYKLDGLEATPLLMKHCAGEVTEAICEYYKHIPQNVFSCDLVTKIEVSTKRFALELADVIMCCLIAAKLNYIDIEQALFDCKKKNEERVDND